MTNQSELEQNENIAIVTIYTPKEALYYFLGEWEENPDTATVIKRIKYHQPPVVRLKEQPHDQPE